MRACWVLVFAAALVLVLPCVTAANGAITPPMFSGDNAATGAADTASTTSGDNGLTCPAENNGCEIIGNCSDGKVKANCTICYPCNNTCITTVAEINCSKSTHTTGTVPTNNTDFSININVTRIEQGGVDVGVNSTPSPGNGTITPILPAGNDTGNTGNDNGSAASGIVSPVERSDSTSGTPENILVNEPPVVKRVYDVIEANETAIVPVSDPDVAVRHIDIRLKNTVSGVEITVAQHPERPVQVEPVPAIAGRPEQRVYNYIEVNHTNIANSNVRSANITFEVRKPWLRENRINATTVSLSRYDMNWTRLKTAVVNESADSVYYEAESPGLSIFAIVGEQLLQYTGSSCVPLDRRCVGKTLQECDMNNGEWENITECEFTCRSDACLNATEAVNGTPREKATGVYLEIIIGMLIIILVLAAMAKYFKGKAKDIQREREIMGLRPSS